MIFQGLPGWRKDDEIKQFINRRCKAKEQVSGVWSGTRDSGYGIRGGEFGARDKAFGSQGRVAGVRC